MSFHKVASSSDSPHSSLLLVEPEPREERRLAPSSSQVETQVAELFARYTAGLQERLASRKQLEELSAEFQAQKQLTQAQARRIFLLEQNIGHVQEENRTLREEARAQNRICEEQSAQITLLSSQLLHSREHLKTEETRALETQLSLLQEQHNFLIEEAEKLSSSVGIYPFNGQKIGQAKTLLKQSAVILERIEDLRAQLRGIEP